MAEATDFIPLINGVAHSWGDITATVGGVPVVGITAIEYGDDQVVENHYGAGRHPVSYSKGRVTPSAKITVAMGEVIGWQAKSRRAVARPRTVPYRCGVHPRGRADRNRQDYELPFQEERPQLERGGHAAARRSRAGAPRISSGTTSNSKFNRGGRDCLPLFIE